jgi:hypothetical protein
MKSDWSDDGSIDFPIVPQVEITANQRRKINGNVRHSVPVGPVGNETPRLLGRIFRLLFIRLLYIYNILSDMKQYS